MSRPILKPVHLFVIVGVFWAGLAGAYWLNRPEPPEFFEQVHSPEFRMGLYNKGAESCVALASLDRLDVLVVGNSHVYAGIDAEAVAQAFPRQRTGVCALGTMRLEFLGHLFDYLDLHGLAPRRLILVVDPSALSLFDIDDEQVRTTLFDEAVRTPILTEWTTARDQGLPLLGQTVAEIREQINFHEAQIEALDLNSVEQILAENTLRHEAYVNAFIGRMRLRPTLERELNEFCTQTRQRRMVVDIVGVPGGPFDLVEHPLEVNGISIANGVEQFVDAFPCERRVVNRTLEGWGLDVRYRLNRLLDDEFDYAMFADPDSFAERYAALPDNRTRHYAYDSSHLNRVGARKFTQMAMRELAD